ncbi:MAG: phosphotransferase [Actinomycetia bacterium]|nr:phosphotransferase [Actinomycetes bacterium]
MSTHEELMAGAVAAAGLWDLDVEEVDLLSFSENAVFAVDTTDQGRVILRLHRPGYNTMAQMESELVWVDSLRDAGIDTPTSLRSARGNGYEMVPVGEETRVAGVIEWIDGVRLEEILGQDPSSVGRHFHKLGTIMAAIRSHGEVWDTPPGFDRRLWDADGLVGLDPLWGRFWEVAELEPSERRLFTQARHVLHRRLSTLPADRSMFGLIHADLHLNNVLASEDRLVVIDFDDAGFSWYLYELAVALAPGLGEPWFDEAADALVDGYRSVHPLSDEELAFLPAFITIRELITVSWLAARPELGKQHFLRWVIDRAVEQTKRHLA